MTHTEAHRILDDRRLGDDIPEVLVTRALQLTGDLESPYNVAEELRAIAKTNWEAS